SGMTIASISMTALESILSQKEVGTLSSPEDIMTKLNDICGILFSLEDVFDDGRRSPPGQR
ncbi:MAG: hypothetical protein KDI79_32010, partial [Anaerolineae bacterium]|nr:hypothetical protein [Anaerolineae bacterium]